MIRGIAQGLLDFAALVIQGKVLNVSRVTTSGKTTIAASGNVSQDIWPGAAVQPLIGGTAVSLEVVSTSVNDTAAGSGMQAIVIAGLDQNYNPITATVNLSGTTPAAVPIQFLRINSARGTMVTPNAGVTQFSAGTVSIRDAGGGTVRGILPAGEGILSQTLYTVPAGYTLVIHSIEVQINSSAGGATKGMDAVLIFRNSNGFATASRKISTTDTLPYALMASTYIPVLEKVDFWMRATYVSTNPTAVGGAWEATLHKN